jgi:hypothetical protein
MGITRQLNRDAQVLDALGFFSTRRKTQARCSKYFAERDVSLDKERSEPADYDLGWSQEDGGSADSVPDTSSHRMKLLPSDMNGPPFFENWG